MPVGQQKRIPSTKPGVKQKQHIFGGYNWFQDTIIWTTALTKNTATFILFLEELLAKQYRTFAPYYAIKATKQIIFGNS